MGDYKPDDSFLETRLKYNEERSKRLRTDGNNQYLDLCSTDNLKSLLRDPWSTPATNENTPLPKHHRVLIVGAGYGGLLFAVRLIQSGAFTADEILIVDSAGGFGGTWYWNRYPGLMCDTESYLYMPLLEETGYMPTQKYVPGNELREHAERIAQKWGLEGRGVFQTAVKSLLWDEENLIWKADVLQNGGEAMVNLTADFVILASGVVNIPKVPDFPGMEEYDGHTFHTSRWDYDYTCGSPEAPELTNLKDKRVGIIGTGATAIQAIPHLAQWAKELFVFQRTPSSVHRRDNRTTDAEWWDKEVKSKGPGWQRQRAENFDAFVSSIIPPAEVDLVDDGWTKLSTYNALVGGPSNLEPSYLDTLHSRDMESQNRVRQRVDDIVENKTTAEALKPWYSTWCKRPCFHDGYLQTFNRDNITLVDTQGKGVNRFTKTGVIVNPDNTEYDLDLIVFSTGYNISARPSPASRADIPILGRNSTTMDQKWIRGVATLHGVVTHDFPNLFFPGTSQAGVSPNFGFVLDQLSSHVSYIISEAIRQQGKSKVIIEPSSTGEEDWTKLCLAHAKAFAGMTNCTPGYLNAEGGGSDTMCAEGKVLKGRKAVFGGGIAKYLEIIEKWRAEGNLEGLDVYAG
ncbi:hypothetical protein ASPWEDRAFT_35909 [Aspergillus wentii DTO 134E9]|uniref:FAD/NAD(P)-binding domain-containing protein n=1 Tax=Aspergillus wentii DTO 134E9 TaxID=1073089 RepID=A0A1L9RTS3_ASPWE|nr:uncharacterized protein ASPWEDRAFT_35909 [Aspergillus wentii DTO 134E9]OJJ38283.1 hypothetical protein ASPWEDRAFT_35909 [Aspergillus wentii DTO 134E9]